MDTKKVLEELDRIFSENDIGETELYLKEKIAQARAEKDEKAELALVNEMMGFYRNVSRGTESLAMAERAVALCDSLQIIGTREYATTILNVATAYLALGRFLEASALYREAEDTYGKQPEEYTYNRAGLYHNMSVCYRELKQPKEAADYADKALLILKRIPGAQIEEAIARNNLAGLLLAEKRYPEAEKYLMEAMDLFKKYGPDDCHYSGVLSTLAQSCYLQKRYQEAETYYEEALTEIKRHFGQNREYRITCQNLQHIRNLRQKEEAEG